MSMKTQGHQVTYMSQTHEQSCCLRVLLMSNEMTDLDGRLSPARTPTCACVPEFTLWRFSRDGVCLRTFPRGMSNTAQA